MIEAQEIPYDTANVLCEEMTGRKQQPYLPRNFIESWTPLAIFCFLSFPCYIEFHTLIYKFQIL